MKDVADNRDLQTFQCFLIAQNRVSIEQRLRGMLVQAIAGVNDRHVEVLRHHVGRAGVGMADNDDVGADGAHRVPGIEQRLALLNTRTKRLDEDRVSAQGFGRDFKRTPRPGGRLVEKQKDALALEQGPRLVRIHTPGKFQKSQDLGCFQVLNTEQGTARWIHSQFVISNLSFVIQEPRNELFNYKLQITNYKLACCFSMSRTFSASSTSRSLTSIISFSVVCTVRPMKAASIGNSRWPRSINTHSCKSLGRPERKSASMAARVVRPV